MTKARASRAQTDCGKGPQPGRQEHRTRTAGVFCTGTDPFFVKACGAGLRAQIYKSIGKSLCVAKWPDLFSVALNSLHGTFDEPKSTNHHAHDRTIMRHLQ